VVIEVVLATVTLLGDPQTQEMRNKGRTRGEGTRPHLRENKKEGGGDSIQGNFRGFRGFRGSGISGASGLRGFHGFMVSGASGAPRYRCFCDTTFVLASPFPQIPPPTQSSNMSTTAAAVVAAVATVVVAAAPKAAGHSEPQQDTETIFGYFPPSSKIAEVLQLLKSISRGHKGVGGAQK